MRAIRVGNYGRAGMHRSQLIPIDKGGGKVECTCEKQRERKRDVFQRETLPGFPCSILLQASKWRECWDITVKLVFSCYVRLDCVLVSFVESVVLF